MTSPTFYKFLRGALVAAALVFMPMCAFADYYVSTTGSDSNSGTQAAPFLTINKAGSVVSAGMTVHVAPGTYTGNISTSANGTASAHIKYVSDVKWGAKIVGIGTEMAWLNTGSYIEVDGFDITTSGRLGFYSMAPFGEIRNCYVHDILPTNVGTAGTGNGGAAIDTIGSNWVIHHNVILRVDVNFLAPNHVHGIYLASANDIVYDNIIGNISARGVGTWHGGTNATIYNNTIFNCGQDGILIGSGDDGQLPTGSQHNLVFNNIVAHSLAYGIREYAELNGVYNMAYVSNNTFANNIVYANGINETPPSSGTTITGTIVADPLFVNYQVNGTGDYHVQSTSPAIDRGTSSYSPPTTDLDGKVRPQGAGYDIGAYEYGSATTPAPTPAPTPTPTPTPPPTSGTIRIEAGSPTPFTDSLGNIWQADTYATGGSLLDWGTTLAIANTIDDRIYQTERYGMTGYAIPVNNGTYTVKLHFAENSIAAIGLRVFSVALEGTTVLSNFDVFQQVGAHTALVKTFTTTVADGVLNIGFIAQTASTLIDGIEIIPTTTLANGVVLTNLSAPTGTQRMYQLTVPAGASNLRFVSSGGAGDIDLYVKFGAQPTTAVFDAKSDGATTAETVSIAAPQAGTYYLLTNGWAAYSGVSLVGAYSITTTDTTAPATPTGLSTSVISSSQINLAWTASIDNIGVTGYKIFRGGIQIATVTGTTYSNTGLSASTAYTYTVAAYDAAGNTSAQSAAASATTQATVTTTGITTLSNGVALTNLSGTIGTQKIYQLTVPAGATNLSFTTSGGTGDIDLYVKFGSQPTMTPGEFKSAGNTNTETISISAPQAGTYYLLTNGWSAYSGVSLVGAYTTVVTSGPVVSLSPISVNFGSVNVGTVSPIAYITLTNTGNATLDTSLAWTVSGDFSFANTGGTCGSSLAPSANCLISVQFSPTVSGTRTGSLSVVTNAASSPNVVQLSGSGVTSTITPPPPPPGGTTLTAAHHLYVATTGSDSNAGTQTSPFQTILKASQVAVPDTIIHVAPGTYNIGTAGFTTGASGTASGHIRYLSDTKWGAKIVGSGTEIVWTNSGNYIEVIGFDIRTSGRLGFYSEGSYGSIYNCYVHDIMQSGGPTGNGGAGIDFIGSDWIVHDNIVRNVDVAGISGTSQTHGIYIAAPNALVYNNIVSGAAATGIVQWHGATHSTIVNNTVFNNHDGILLGSGDGGALPNGSQNNYVANNIIVNNVRGIYECCTVGATSQNTYRNNLFYNNNDPTNINNTVTGGAGDVISGTVTANPLFVNYQANGTGDYHVQSTSPAVNAGISTNAPATDLDGVARPQGAGFDIGAYER